MMDENRSTWASLRLWSATDRKNLTPTTCSRNVYLLLDIAHSTSKSEFMKSIGAIVSIRRHVFVYNFEESTIKHIKKKCE